MTSGGDQSCQSSRVSYDPAIDGLLADFDKTPKGAAVRAEYRADIAKLLQFLRSPGPVVSGQEIARQNLKTFEERISEGINGPYSTALHALYGGGKEALGSIVDRINSDRSSPKEKFKADIVEMALGLQVCGPGVASHLMMAAQRMNSDIGGVRGYAQHIWETLFDNALRTFVEREHGKEEHYRGNEIHLVNRYRNLLKKDFYVMERPDDFVPPQVGLGGRLERCHAFLAQHVTPTHLLLHMAEDCLQTVHEHFSEYRDTPLDEEQVWSLRQKYEGSLSANLAMKYGEIAPHILINEHHGENSHAADQYRLIDNPTLLMRTISKNLFKADIFDSTYKPLRIAGQKGGERVLKHIGDDIFYTRKNRKEMAEYRPLRTDELMALKRLLPELQDIETSSPLFASMVRGALANTKSSALLKQLTPELVWSALTQGIDTVNMLARLVTPSLRRYRQASKVHEASLLDLACQAICSLAPEQRQKALLFASAQGESSLGQRIGETLDSVSELDERGMSALHYTVLNADMELLGSLAPKAKDIVNIADDQDRTPLMLAALNGRGDAIGILLGAGAMVNQQNREGWTALMLTAQSGHADVIEKLLKAGASVDEKNRRGSTALIVAAFNGHTDVIGRLLDADARVNEKNFEGWTALMLAAHNGHAAAAARLLGAGARVDEKKGGVWTALMLAAVNGHADAIERLLEAGAKIDEKDPQGWSALTLAALNGHADAIDRLLGAGANVNNMGTQGETALMIAASGGHKDAIERLLGAGAKLDDRSSRGETALMAAAFNGHIDAIEQLLGAGAKVDDKSLNGETALMAAAFNGHTDVIERLLGAGADINDKNAQGWTALMMAAKNGHANASGRLIVAGAWVNEKDLEGRTALMQAKQNGHYEVVEQLLEAGAEND